VNPFMKRFALFKILWLVFALGQAQNETSSEATHAEVEPIKFGKHVSGHSITIKTIAMTHNDDLLVGISWGEGKMEFAEPSSDAESSRRGRPNRSGGGIRSLPVIVALDENKDGEISAEEIENAEKALIGLDEDGDGKLSGSEVRPSGGQRGRPSGGRSLSSGKSQAEVKRILEFGTEDEIVKLVGEVEPGQFFEAIRDMDYEDRQKIMRILPEEIRQQFRNRRSGTRQRGGNRGAARDEAGNGRPERRGNRSAVRDEADNGRPERRGNRGPLSVDDLFKHTYSIRVVSPNGSIKAEWPMPDDGPHPKMIHNCEDGTVYVAGHGKIASYDKDGKRLAMVDVDEISGSKSLAAGLFVSEKYVFFAVGTGNSMRATEDIYRFKRDLTGAKKIIEQQYGCCSHIDMQVMNGELLIAENSRHRVNRFSLDGKRLGRWGKRDRTGIEGFAACCNPVNIDIGPDNVLYTAESGVGRIKKYTPDGKFLGVVGYVDTTEFDRGGKLAAQTCYIPIEVNKDASRVYIMDVRANLIRVLAPKKK